MVSVRVCEFHGQKNRLRRFGRNAGGPSILAKDPQILASRSKATPGRGVVTRGGP
jgi:hypothetical protein